MRRLLWWITWPLRWPFTTSPREEALVDRLNSWFGGVPGIKQVLLLLGIYPAVQYLLPPRYRWDPWPFVFEVLLITIVSLTSNQWLMNQGMRSSRITDNDRAAIRRNTETLLHLAQTMREVLLRLEELMGDVQERVEEIADAKDGEG